MRNLIVVVALSLLLCTVISCGSSRATYADGIATSGEAALAEQHQITATLRERGENELAERSAQQAQRLGEIVDELHRLSAYLRMAIYGEE